MRSGGLVYLFIILGLFALFLQACVVVKEKKGCSQWVEQDDNIFCRTCPTDVQCRRKRSATVFNGVQAWHQSDNPKYQGMEE